MADYDEEVRARAEQARQNLALIERTPFQPITAQYTDHAGKVTVAPVVNTINGEAAIQFPGLDEPTWMHADQVGLVLIDGSVEQITARLGGYYRHHPKELYDWIDEQLDDSTPFGDRASRQDSVYRVERLSLAYWTPTGKIRGVTFVTTDDIALVDQHLPWHEKLEAGTDLAGATDRGELNAWAASPGEFAARWNARTEAGRAELMLIVQEQLQLSLNDIVYGHRSCPAVGPSDLHCMGRYEKHEVHSDGHGTTWRDWAGKVPGLWSMPL